MVMEKVLGIVGGLIGILAFIFVNIAPNSNEISTVILVFGLLIPSCGVIYASLTQRILLFIIFVIWSLPLSLYISSGEGFFKYIWINLALFLISFVLMVIKKRPGI